ncbi:hypothetical protein [Desulfonatronum sp. SC1]|uniref:hypothetical protein n=1 Tax=Desulfonatronum sp. SC1 TaxID=2109626 RepID=UPI000D3077FC|nr:hypothetical protein [Desulfonatronum sp. SC1]PTN32679.1 hypothetical protein C6366_16075 [Desulfonatronum sp. SC1]
MTENPLQTQTIDRTAAVVRGVVGAVPVIGPLVAEVISGVIPGQKLQRLEQWLHLFSTRVHSLEDGVKRLNDRLRTPKGSDLLEDALLEASRAVSDERLERLASLFANGLAGLDFEHDRVKTLSRLFGNLTDAEIVLLTFYAQPPTLSSPWHKAMMERHPEILKPVSRAMGSPQSEIDRGALQDHRKDTLLRLGLLQSDDRSTSITSLGRLLVNQVVDESLFEGS